MSLLSLAFALVTAGITLLIAAACITVWDATQGGRYD